jgi:hypothetical protein
VGPIQGREITVRLKELLGKALLGFAVSGVAFTVGFWDKWPVDFSGKCFMMLPPVFFGLLGSLLLIGAIREAGTKPSAERSAAQQERPVKGRSL